MKRLFMHTYARAFRWQQIPILCIALSLLIFPKDSAGQNSLWLTAGQNINNTRHATQETAISPATAPNLSILWELETAGDVSATLAVDGDYVYFPDWAGNLNKVDAATGAVVWSHPFSYYTGVTGDFARATPAVSGNSLIIGTQLSFAYPATLNGAHVLSINKNTGELQWITQTESHPGAVVTQSPVVFGNKVYVGVASQEEFLATNPFYPCCSFRGSIACLNLNTGAIQWKTYMAPEGLGFSGCAVWGSTPVVDPKRGSLYITTGNNYTVPEEILDCVAAGGTAEEVQACIMAVEGSAQNFFDAIVALNLNTGAVKWATSVIPFDAWTVACFFGGPNCPEEAGPDYDFGQGPSLISYNDNGMQKEILGAGQKSGIYWALNPDNGQVLWNTQVGPGGELGGMQWGSASDGNRIYVAISNSNFIPHLMSVGPGAGQVVNGGFWAALDVKTGEVLWENAVFNPPGVPPFFPLPYPPNATNQAPMAVANGVVFGAAMDAVGHMYAFDSATGEILWSFASGGSVLSGAAISEGAVYWGSGYANFGLGTPNHKVFAFVPSAPPPALQAAPTNPVIPHDALEQIAPNPFQGYADIRFSLEQAGHVRIRIVDLVGHEVATLVNTVMPAGNHVTRWQPDGNIPTGTYLCQMTTATFSTSSYIVRIQ